MDHQDRHPIPLFRTYTLEHLARLTPYSRRYLADLYAGKQKLRPQTRRVLAACLGESEDELFGPEETL